jgi:hypothetical protein
MSRRNARRRTPPRFDCEPCHMAMVWILLIPMSIHSKYTAGVLSRKHPMLIDAVTLIVAFAAGYGLRAWISARRRRAMRKARGD